MVLALFWVWMGKVGFLVSLTSFNNGSIRIQPEPVWQLIYWAVLAGTLVEASSDFAVFLDPPFGRTRLWIRLGLDLGRIAVASLLVNVTDWMTITVDKMTPDQMSKVMVWLNGSLHFGVIAVIVFAVIDAVVNLRRLMGRPPVALTQLPTVYL